jgi:hypothetical protein
VIDPNLDQNGLDAVRVLDPHLDQAPQLGARTTENTRARRREPAMLSRAQAPRSLQFSDRQNVAYAAAAAMGVMPRSWKRFCMPMRRVS